MYLSLGHLSIEIKFLLLPPLYHFFNDYFVNSCSSSYLKQDTQEWVGYKFLRNPEKMIPRIKLITFPAFNVDCCTSPLESSQNSVT